MRDAATPYGFTVALWLSSSLLARGNGKPGVPEILLFGGGALLGFVAVGEVIRRIGDALRPPEHWSLARAMHILPVALVLGGVELTNWLAHSWSAWLSGGLVASFGYFGGVGAESYFAVRRASR